MTPEQTKAVATLLAAVGEPTRLRIVRHLAAGEMNVGDLMTALGMKLANLPRHLRRMREAGVVTSRKDGPFMYYSLVGAKVTKTGIVLTRPGVTVTMDV